MRKSRMYELEIIIERQREYITWLEDRNAKLRLRENNSDDYTKRIKELDRENTNLAERCGRLEKALEASAKYNRELVAENNNAKRKPEKVYSLKCTVCGKKITAKSLLTKYCDKCRVEKQRACMRAYKAKRK